MYESLTRTKLRLMTAPSDLAIGRKHRSGHFTPQSARIDLPFAMESDRMHLTSDALVTWSNRRVGPLSVIYFAGRQ